MTTHLAKFKATVNHEPHGGLLFKASFTPDLEKRVLKAYGIDSMSAFSAKVGMFSMPHIGPWAPAKTVKPDFTGYYEGVDMPEGSYIDGNGTLHIPGSMYHFTRYISPLRNAEKFEEIEAFPYPNVKGYTTDHMKAEVDKAHAEGRPVAVSIGHMYESAWQIRDYENFLMDMLLRPEWPAYILDRLMERNKAIAIAGAEAGADMLYTGDDVANQNNLMFSHEQWQTFMKARWAEVYAAARAIKPDIEIWYHSDGNISSIIPELLEIGVTILNPVQPECVDPEQVKKEYGKRLVIDGAIGTQTVMPFGTARDVKDTIKRYARSLGADGAYIISPTHVLEPEVPLDNIKAFFDTCAALET